ncbi:MAG: SDR family oxidoreductase [Gammaproteobacteria bacterium]
MRDTVLITGCNRGLGLEFVRQYAQAGWRVFATCRNPEQAMALNLIASASQERITVHRLDITNRKQINDVVSAIGETPIDLLLNNAGIDGQRNSQFGATDEARWLEAFRVNSIAQLKIMEAFIGSIARGKKRMIVCVGSKMASMSENSSGGSYVYRSTKAALNAIVRSAAIDLRSKDIAVVVVHPGWVRTDMGGLNAQIDAADSVRRLRVLVDKITLADSGKFLNMDGTLITW